MRAFWTRGSEASALTGEVHGPDELEELRVDRAYWYAWKRTHPGSRVLAR